MKVTCTGDHSSSITYDRDEFHRERKTRCEGSYLGFPFSGTLIHSRIVIGMFNSQTEKMTVELDEPKEYIGSIRTHLVVSIQLGR